MEKTQYKMYDTHTKTKADIRKASAAWSERWREDDGALTEVHAEDEETGGIKPIGGLL